MIDHDAIRAAAAEAAYGPSEPIHTDRPYTDPTIDYARVADIARRARNERRGVTIAVADELGLTQPAASRAVEGARRRGLDIPDTRRGQLIPVDAAPAEPDEPWFTIHDARAALALEPGDDCDPVADGRWRRRANCLGVDPDLMVPAKGDATTGLAKAVCRGCDVKAECLTVAMVTREIYGCWGSFSPKDRRALRRRLRNGDPLRVKNDGPEVA